MKSAAVKVPHTLSSVYYSGASHDSALNESIHVKGERSIDDTLSCIPAMNSSANTVVMMRMGADPTNIKSNSIVEIIDTDRLPKGQIPSAREARNGSDEEKKHSISNILVAYGPST